MSANVHAVLVGLLSVPHTPEQADHAARTVLDLHAHELAEQIREEAERRKAQEEQRFGRLDHESELQLGGMHDAAALIDPKAQRAASTGDNT